MDPTHDATPADPNPLATAREVALGFLDRRMYSRWELSGRLRRRGYSREVIEAVLDDLARADLLDDVAFARAFTSDRVRLAPRGYVRILQELRGRGVARADAEAAVRIVEEEHPEADVARELLRTRARRLVGLDAEARRRRVMTWLRGRGFRTETIFRLMDEDPDID